MDMDIDMPKSATDLAQLKEQLRAAIAGRLDGLDIDTPNHWRIAPVNDPIPFFTNLATIMPANAILYLEGASISQAARALYNANRAEHAVPVARDTIFPVPD